MVGRFVVVGEFIGIRYVIEGDVVFVWVVVDINVVSLLLLDNLKDGFGLVGVGFVKVVIVGFVFNFRKVEFLEICYVVGFIRKFLYGIVYNFLGLM